jgi:photosystem II stability/assembly factor-like uncharacterized protein
VLYEVFDEDNPSNSHYMTTTDGGETWTGFQFSFISSDAQLNHAHMPDSNRVWIVGEEDNQAIVLISTNGGVSWEKVVVADVSSFSSVQFVNANEGYATVGEHTVAAEPKLYYTMDGGYTWEPIAELSKKNGMSRVSFFGPDLGLVIGQGSTVYKYTVD